MRILAQSKRAFEVYETLSRLQDDYVQKLNTLSTRYGDNKQAVLVEWLRDEGKHGGGVRFELKDESTFNRGSINISQVHYDDLPDKKLASATALSAIVHPAHPLAPSMHMHISWTEMKTGQGTWRMMADLNPSVVVSSDSRRFYEALKEVGSHHFLQAVENAERYFYIPALQRTRGVVHFYLEGYYTDDFQADLTYAKRIGTKVIDTYTEILQNHFAYDPPATDAQKKQQLAYHTLYFFQVLTLDRGTTSGLLVHDQNDLGILGSLPSCVDRSLLHEWIKNVHPKQRPLLSSIVDVLPNEHPAFIDDNTKLRLARTVRSFYRNHPEAIDYQAATPRQFSAAENHR